MDRFSAMETYVMVVESGSFTSASKRLKVGQPAVSKSIAQLEEWLGVRLLLRSTRTLTPTEAGQRFYEYARRTLDEADEADRAVRATSSGLGGRLRVSAAVTFARLHVVPHLAQFLDEHPDLSIDLVLDDRPVDLLGEGIDVALRMGDLSDSSMTARKIGRGRRAVLGTAAYFARHGTPKVPADLVSHKAVVYEQGNSSASWSFSQHSTETSIAVTGRLRVSAAEGVRAAVLADLGVCMTSEWMFAPELANGTVQRVLTEWSLPSMDLWAVFPTGRMASAKARAFAAFVESIVGTAD